MPTQARSPLVTQRSYRVKNSSLVGVAEGCGWLPVRTPPRSVLAQDGAALEARRREEGCCWVPLSLSAWPATPGLWEAGRQGAGILQHDPS
jgi:hypothetical protein